MAPEFWCKTTPTEFWCHGISDAKLHFADVAPLLEFGTTTPRILSVSMGLRIDMSLASSCYRRGFLQVYVEFRRISLTGFRSCASRSQTGASQSRQST
ncbi:hypothetical protein Tco_0868775, partial [Tanacetum coccineum]